MEGVFEENLPGSLVLGAAEGLLVGFSVEGMISFVVLIGTFQLWVRFFFGKDEPTSSMIGLWEHLLLVPSSSISPLRPNSGSVSVEDDSIPKEIYPGVSGTTASGLLFERGPTPSLGGKGTVGRSTKLI